MVALVHWLMPPHDMPASRPLLFLAGALLGLLAIQVSGPAEAEPEPEPPAEGVVALGHDDVDGTVIGTYPPPDGAEAYRSEGFGAWLQALELEAPSVPVRTHDGRVVPGDFHVVKLPLVSGNLQQCADTAIRLRAEWLREQGQPVMFHATSGDPMPWARYQGGEKAHEQGNRLSWRDAPHQSWDQYLSAVFMWAGTRSLAYDTVADDVPTAGDILVLPGSPGHAVILLAVAHGAGGTYVLVGQGYMPAQSFHIVRGPHRGWWKWDDGVRVGPWEFPGDSLRAWDED